MSILTTEKEVYRDVFYTLAKNGSRKNVIYHKNHSKEIHFDPLYPWVYVLRRKDALKMIIVALREIVNAKAPTTFQIEVMAVAPVRTHRQQIGKNTFPSNPSTVKQVTSALGITWSFWYDSWMCDQSYQTTIDSASMCVGVVEHTNMLWRKLGHDLMQNEESAPWYAMTRCFSLEPIFADLRDRFEVSTK